VRARRSHGLRRSLVRRAPLPDELLDVAVPGGHLRRAEPADETDPARLRRRDPAVPPPGAGCRARGHGRSHVGRAGRVRHRSVGAVRADGHGDRSAQHARDVGRVAAHDPEDLGGRPLLGGRAVLEGAAARRAAEALSEAAPADLGRGTAAGDLRAGRRDWHRRDGAERGSALVPGAPHQAVQGAGTAGEARRQVCQRPVAQLDDGAVRLGQPRRARAGGEIAPDLLRPGPPVPEGPDPPLRAARRLVGRRARASEGELLALPQDRRSRRRARGGSVGRIRPDRVGAVESDRRRHPGGARRARGGRSRELPARDRDPRGSRRRRAAVLDGDRDRAARSSDDVDRDVRQARHPRAQEEVGGRSGPGQTRPAAR